MKRPDISKRIILKSIIIVFSAIIMGACANTSRPSNQGEAQGETTTKRLNRNVKIGFQGISLGSLNKDIATLLKQLENVTPAEIPYKVKQNSSGSNASCYANDYEGITATFESTIIDNTETAHEGYGMLFSDGDSITKIVFTIMESGNPEGVYKKLFPLFYNQYGAPDESYESEVESYLQNIGAFWVFDNKQRICLNRCVYAGGASGEFGDLFKTYQRVEVIYQDLNALERKDAREKEEEQKRIDAQKAKEEQIRSTNKAKRQSQQL